MTRTAGLRLSHQSVVPQVCPHLVNVAVSLWKLPAETFTRDRQEPDHRRSDALYGHSGGGAGAPAGKGRGERGETRRGPNITPRGGLRQGAIHRLSNGCEAATSGVVCRGDIHTHGRLSAPGAGDGPDDLTWSFARAYRSWVTRCRRVPHVHAIPPSAVARPQRGRGVRGWAVPAETTGPVLGFDQLRPTPSGDLAGMPA